MAGNIKKKQTHKTTKLIGLVPTLIAITVSGLLTVENLLDAQTRSAITSIKVTEVPAAGEGNANATELIGGVAKGPNLPLCKVILYAHTNTWYVQPTTADPYTEIDPNNGKWQNSTHPGAEYAALLVTSSYKPEATRDKLPGIGGDVLAKDVRRGK